MSSELGKLARLSKTIKLELETSGRPYEELAALMSGITVYCAAQTGNPVKTMMFLLKRLHERLLQFYLASVTTDNTKN